MLLVTGKEKAWIGGLVSALGTIIVQLYQSGQLTLKEVFISLGAFVVTHFAVWMATNTPPSPADAAAVLSPTVVAPEKTADQAGQGSATSQ